MNYTILQGDNRETMKTLTDNSVDAIVTDPPYGIDFLGKSWDANTGALETYQECLRVLKPGGYILAFSAARTYHHLAITLEQAGFEIRDQIMWIYSSGFPKSQDIGKNIARSENKLKNTKTYLPDIDDTRNVANSTTGSPRCQMCDKSTGPIWKKCPDERADCIRPWEPDLQDNEWNGWGTALKPGHEPIALARKPTKLSFAKNVEKWGLGGLNIDDTRIPYAGPNDKPVPHGGKARQHKDTPGWMADNTGYKIIENPEINPKGRFPSNVIGEILQDDYQKYFYCPKVSRKERHMGFDLKEIPTDPGGMLDNKSGELYNASTKKKHDPLGHIPRPGSNGHGGGVYEHNTWGDSLSAVNNAYANLPPGEVIGNNHPTVKPVALMRYLIKLVTPPNSVVLDPFNGSGSTGMAAVELGHTYIGCELDPNYVEITKNRIKAWNSSSTTFTTLFDEE